MCVYVHKCVHVGVHMCVCVWVWVGVCLCVCAWLDQAPTQHVTFLAHLLMPQPCTTLCVCVISPALP